MSNVYPRDYAFPDAGIIITLNTPAEDGNYQVIDLRTGSVDDGRFVINFQIQIETSPEVWEKVASYDGVVMLRVGYEEKEDELPVNLYVNDTEYNKNRTYPNDETDKFDVPGIFFSKFIGHFLIVDQQRNFPDPRIGVGP